MIESKPIIGFPHYTIFSNGTIQGPRKLRKLKLNREGGYLVLCLSKKSIAYWFSVHCLVAKHFLGPRPKGMTVNHKDGNKLNNAVENLEYLTHQENIKHAFRLGLRRPLPREVMQKTWDARRGQKAVNRKFNKVIAEQIRVLYRDSGISMSKLANRFCTSTSEIHRIIHRQIFD